MSLALAVALVVFAAPAAARSEAPSCHLVSPAVIRSVLGVTVGPLTRQADHSTLVCSYSVTGVPDAVKVTFESGVSSAEFSATRTSFAHAYQHVRAVHGIGDSAFEASQGTGPFASTLLFVHKGSNEIGVTAVASLARCERLARLLLPHV
ncbi:MAG TPA: hypothetical protein VGU02_01360 [Gaiellaceae bacterium]|nr:hypothetical protein [Gaiellaceae bacterium]